jgi:hypothetical protein
VRATVILKIPRSLAVAAIVSAGLIFCAKFLWTRLVSIKEHNEGLSKGRRCCAYYSSGQALTPRHGGGVRWRCAQKWAFLHLTPPPGRRYALPVGGSVPDRQRYEKPPFPPFDPSWPFFRCCSAAARGRVPGMTYWSSLTRSGC